MPEKKFPSDCRDNLQPCVQLLRRGYNKFITIYLNYSHIYSISAVKLHCSPVYNKIAYFEGRMDYLSPLAFQTFLNGSLNFHSQRYWKMGNNPTYGFENIFIFFIFTNHLRKGVDHYDSSRLRIVLKQITIHTKIDLLNLRYLALNLSKRFAN